MKKRQNGTVLAKLDSCFTYIKDQVAAGYHPTASDIEQEVLKLGGNVDANVFKLLDKLRTQGRLQWTVVDGQRQFSFPEATVVSVIDVTTAPTEQLVDTLKRISKELDVRSIIENQHLGISREEWEQTPVSVQNVVLDLSGNVL